MTFPSDRFCWFEYVSKDSAKAQGFFGELFNWTTKTVPIGTGTYTLIALGDQTIGAYLPTPDGAPTHAHWLSHLQVESAEATLAKVKAAGGRQLKAPSKMGDVGTWAVVADSVGATFALWQPAKAEAAEYRGVAGAFCWNELYTDDPAKAVSFYEAIGGLKDAPMDMGPMGTYHVLKSHGKDRAGIMKSPMPASRRTGCRTSRSRAPTRPSRRPGSSAATSSCRRTTCPASAASPCSSIRSARRSGSFSLHEKRARLPWEYRWNQLGDSRQPTGSRTR